MNVNEVLIRSRQELGADCGGTRQILVRLSVTDPEGLTGGGITTFTDALPACIN